MNTLIDIHSHKNPEGKDGITLYSIFPKSFHQNMEGFFSVGIHPWYAKIDDELNLEKVRQAAEINNCLAIGEIGLDKSRPIDMAVQLELFQKQIEIAEKNKRPIVIHCVRAYQELIEIRKKSNLKNPWIIHGFNSSEQIASELIKLNCFLSFGNLIFKNNSKAANTLQKIPLENIFLETDEGDYSILEVYNKTAAIKSINVEILKEQIAENFLTCFPEMKSHI